MFIDINSCILFFVISVIYACENNCYLYRLTVALNIASRWEMLLFFWNLIQNFHKNKEVMDLSLWAMVWVTQTTTIRRFSNP